MNINYFPPLLVGSILIIAVAFRAYDWWQERKLYRRNKDDSS